MRKLDRGIDKVWSLGARTSKQTNRTKEKGTVVGKVQIAKEVLFRHNSLAFQTGSLLQETRQEPTLSKARAAPEYHAGRSFFRPTARVSSFSFFAVFPGVCSMRCW